MAAPGHQYEIQIVGPDGLTVWDPSAPAAPSGSATAAKQDTGNTSLATIATNTAQGTKITAATIPTGGVGFFGWLSAIWYQLTQTLGVQLNADARNAALTSGLWTLANGVVESITIPSYARGFRLRPSADIRFAIGEDPVAAGTETLTVGATAFANENEVRLIEAGAVTLRLLATGATTVQVSFF